MRDDEGDFDVVKYVALLRGINVGGNRKMKMADLKAVMADAGFDAVQTYVQSGNVVFEDKAQPVDGISKTLEAACEKAFGFHSEILVRGEATFRAEAAACPYADEALEPLDGREPKFLHVAYFSAAPDAAKVQGVIDGYDGPEEIMLKGNALYIYFAHGTGRSDFTKLMTEKKLGTSVTARNWNTVLKLLSMLDG